MTESELTQLLSEAFPGAQVSVALEGGHVDITVISAEFEGLRPIASSPPYFPADGAFTLTAWRTPLPAKPTATLRVPPSPVSGTLSFIRQGQHTPATSSLAIVCAGASRFRLCSAAGSATARARP